MPVSSKSAHKAWETKRTPMPERFWRLVQIKGHDECWPFLGYRGPYGHGKFRLNGRCHPSGRIAWIVTNGDAGKMCVLHTCDNGWCCNPKHLYLGTQKDNARDASERLRYPPRHGELAANAVLTNKEAIAIRTLYATGQWTYVKLADKFGVCKSNIGWIVRGRHFAVQGME